MDLPRYSSLKLLYTTHYPHAHVMGALCLAAMPPLKDSAADADHTMVDYRALNYQTNKITYPLPRIDDHIDKLLQALCLSTINLASGYHQVCLAPDNCKIMSL